MENGKYINIQYPFQDSPDGLFLNLNRIDKDAIKSDLLHLLLTRKGERLYNPDFGSDLLKFIFEPKDNVTATDIKVSLNETIRKFIPNLTINEIQISDSDTNEHRFDVRIEYVVTDDVFRENDFVIISL